MENYLSLGLVVATVTGSKGLEGNRSPLDVELGLNKRFHTLLERNELPGHDTEKHATKEEESRDEGKKQPGGDEGG